VELWILAYAILLYGEGQRDPILFDQHDDAADASRMSIR
jgi:hypothetical protein